MNSIETIPKKEGAASRNPLQAFENKNGSTKLTVVDSILSSLAEEKFKGFIQLPRWIEELPVWNDPLKRYWLIDIWFAVNFIEKPVVIGNKTILCKRGQCVRSIGTWAKTWRIDENKVRRFFKLLEDHGVIVTENVGKTTRLTLCIYDSYKNERRDYDDNLTALRRDGNEVVTTTKERKESNKVNNSISINGSSPIKSFKNYSEEDFLNEINSYSAEFSEEIRTEFFKRWSEKSASGKMKFQLEKTWETKKRLETWKRNAEIWNKPSLFKNTRTNHSQIINPKKDAHEFEPFNK